MTERMTGLADGRHPLMKDGTGRRSRGGRGTRSRQRHTMCAAVLLLSAMVTAPSAAAEPDALTVLREWGRFGVFSRLVEQAGLVETLRGPGPLTVFAPDDEAFRRLDAQILEDLQTPEKRDQLRALLRYHLVAQRLSVFELRREAPRATIAGKTVTSLLMGNIMMVNDAFITAEDIAAGNGLIHGIDKVLTPPP